MFVIEGKSAFLYSNSSFKKDEHTTNTPEGAMLMLDEIIKIMNDRYDPMNANPDDDADITYCEKYNVKAPIYWFMDDLQVLITWFKAEVK